MSLGFEPEPWDLQPPECAMVAIEFQSSWILAPALEAFDQPRCQLFLIGYLPQLHKCLRKVDLYNPETSSMSQEVCRL